jgi:hypothetical protein
VPVDLDFDGDGRAAFLRGVFQIRSESPCQVGIEIFELQALFLQSNLFQIAFNGHGISLTEKVETTAVPSSMPALRQLYDAR